MNILSQDMVCFCGDNINEDIANINKWGAWVLDGATGLNKRNLMEVDSDAKWFVQEWNNYLTSNMNNKSYTLKEITQKGIDLIKDKFYSSNKNVKIEPIDLPSSSIALLRWGDNHLEYILIGDCTLAIKNKSNIKVIKDNNVTKLDDEIFSKMKEIMNNEKKSLIEAKEKVFDLIVQNRLLKNTEKGYWILEFDKKAVDNAIYDKISICENTEILIMSDGFSSLFDKYEYINIHDMFCEIKERGLMYLYKQLRRIENEDENGNKYPRFKKSDDASAVYALLG